MRTKSLAGLVVLLASLCMVEGRAAEMSGTVVEGRGLEASLAALATGQVTAAGLVSAYTARIAALDAAGPRLQAVLVMDGAAADAAAASDAARAGGSRRPLEGVPVLVKDNVDVAGMATTAGSLALAANIRGRDAPLVARLRAAGAVILGKTNLSEWANFRGAPSLSGWSGVGGLTRNPYALDRSPCGSSSGSGSAVAASLAPAAIGTETDGSITCPASLAGLVGLKPTVGLVPRTGIVPISASQDTAGPMTHTVRDAALMLGVIAGGDAADPASAPADAHKTDYLAGLRGAEGALAGARIGVLRFLAGTSPATDAAFGQALAVLHAAGATLVEIVAAPSGMDAIADAEQTVLLTEFKVGVEHYLAGAPATVGSRTLADLIAFNTAHASRELGLFGQELFVKAAATHGLADPVYQAALATGHRLSREQGIDKMLADNHVVALVAPSGGPAWTVDLLTFDHDVGGASSLPAVAGYPHLTVPAAQIDGMPVGLSFIGPAWSELTLLRLGYAYEQRRGPLPGPSYRLSVALPDTSLLAPAAAP